MSIHKHIGEILERIAKQDTALKAYCDVRRHGALHDAVRLDATPPEAQGALHGLAVAVKEIFDVEGCRCAWGSEIHIGRIPGRDAPLVSALKSAGAVILGTVASSEYAMAREASTQNPHDPKCTPGASSSGSAAAVAAGLADFAIGSQTVGSGIRPAAYCGVLGFKPTHGWASLDCCMMLSQHLDHAAIFARDIDIIRRVYHTLSKIRSSNGAKTVFRHVSKRPSVKLLSPWFDEPIDRRIWNGICAFAREQLAAPDATVLMPALYQKNEEKCLETILSHDIWKFHHKDYATTQVLMSPQLIEWLQRGRSVSEKSYLEALALRDQMAATFWSHFPGEQMSWSRCRP